MTRALNRFVTGVMVTGVSVIRLLSVSRTSPIGAGVCRRVLIGLSEVSVSGLIRLTVLLVVYRSRVSCG